MTRQKVDVIPASVRSVQNGGQLKARPTSVWRLTAVFPREMRASRLPTRHRKHSTKTSSPGSPAGFLPAFTRMKQNLVRTGNIEKNSTA